MMRDLRRNCLSWCLSGGGCKYQVSPRGTSPFYSTLSSSLMLYNQQVTILCLKLKVLQEFFFSFAAKSLKLTEKHYLSGIHR